MPQKTLQIDIFQRFMSPEKFDKLMQEYRGASKKGWSYSRKQEYLQTPLAKRETDMINDYFDNLDMKPSDVAVPYKMTASQFQYAVMKLALRLVYQTGLAR
jgi:hypothetical protein